VMKSRRYGMCCAVLVSIGRRCNQRWERSRGFVRKLNSSLLIPCCCGCHYRHRLGVFVSMFRFYVFTFLRFYVFTFEGFVRPAPSPVFHVEVVVILPGICLSNNFFQLLFVCMKKIRERCSSSRFSFRWRCTRVLWRKDWSWVRGNTFESHTRKSDSAKRYE
jgi:hypothetical protein